MRATVDGLPALLKGKAFGLAVRIKNQDGKGDVEVVDGQVRPGGGGMSAADDPQKIAPFRLPPEYGGDDPTLTVFHIESEQLDPDLSHRQNGENHYLVEPAYTCSFDRYEVAVEATQHSWMRHVR